MSELSAKRRRSEERHDAPPMKRPRLAPEVAGLPPDVHVATAPAQQPLPPPARSSVAAPAKDGAPEATAPAPAAAPAPALPPKKADFGLSGALAEDKKTGAVTVSGVKLKYAPPSDAALPSEKWRLHVFKSDGSEEVLPVHAASSYLFGRDRAVADVPTDHLSCSSQHAVLQYRRVVIDAGLPGAGVAATLAVKPYVIDLDSTNGVTLNGRRLPPARFVELRALDVLRFGLSTREYVLLHEGVAGGKAKKAAGAGAQA